MSCVYYFICSCVVGDCPGKLCGIIDPKYQDWQLPLIIEAKRVVTSGIIQFTMTYTSHDVPAAVVAQMCTMNFGIQDLHTLCIVNLMNREFLNTAAFEQKQLVTDSLR